MKCHCKLHFFNETSGLLFTVKSGRQAVESHRSGVGPANAAAGRQPPYMDRLLKPPGFISSLLSPLYMLIGLFKEPEVLTSPRPSCVSYPQLAATSSAAPPAGFKSFFNLFYYARYLYAWLKCAGLLDRSLVAKCHVFYHEEAFEVPPVSLV